MVQLGLSGGASIRANVLGHMPAPIAADGPSLLSRFEGRTEGSLANFEEKNNARRAPKVDEGDISGF